MAGRAGGRRRHDDVPTVPIDALLDLGQAGVHVDRRAAAGEGGQAAKTVARGRCPLHAHHALTSVVRDGDHLAWREHTFRTWSGAPFTCAGSLQRLCAQPSRYVPGEDTPTCPCLTTPELETP